MKYQSTSNLDQIYWIYFLNDKYSLWLNNPIYLLGASNPPCPTHMKTEEGKGKGREWDVEFILCQNMKQKVKVTKEKLGLMHNM